MLLRQEANTPGLLANLSCSVSTKLRSTLTLRNGQIQRLSTAYKVTFDTLPPSYTHSSPHIAIIPLPRDYYYLQGSLAEGGGSARARTRRLPQGNPGGSSSPGAME